MTQTEKEVEDELIRAMREEIKKALAEERCDSIYAEGRAADRDADCERRERTMMSLIAASVRTQRLYFVVRSAIMSLISAFIALIVVWYLGAIGVAQAVFLGISMFVVSLVVSRLFDKHIVKLSGRIVEYLNKHRRARSFVLRNL